MMLCEGRHSISEAEDGAIFGNEINLLAVEEMEIKARERLEDIEV